MLEKLETLEKRYEELNALMAQPEVAVDHERLQALAKEQAAIADPVITRDRDMHDAAYGDRTRHNPQPLTDRTTSADRDLRRIDDGLQGDRCNPRQEQKL